MTSTYFEVQAERNPLAQRGYSRDHRPNCKQLLIALEVSFDGFPLGYEVFAGNVHDSRTLQTIVTTMEARHGIVGRVWIGGMASAENLAWLRATGRRYIIGVPKSELKRFAGALASADGRRAIREGVEVKLTRDPRVRGDHHPVPLGRPGQQGAGDPRGVHPADRGRVAAANRRLDPAEVNQQIGRILQQNQRAAARFAVRLEDGGAEAGFRLVVEVRPSFEAWAALSEGAYLLRSNIVDWREDQLWKAYIQLTQAEAAFRIKKDQLRVRPVWHQRADRVEAHILVCFLAFVLWKTWRCGSSAPASAIPRAPCSKSWRASIPTMSSCPPQHTARSACAASPNPIPPGRTPRPARPRPAQAHAPNRTRPPAPQRLTASQSKQICSADFCNRGKSPGEGSMGVWLVGAAN